MNVSFHDGRYLLALLWHWSIPFVFASVLAIQGASHRGAGLAFCLYERWPYRIGPA